MAEKISTMDVRAPIDDLLYRVVLRQDELIIERKASRWPPLYRSSDSCRCGSLPDSTRSSFWRGDGRGQGRDYPTKRPWRSRSMRNVRRVQVASGPPRSRSARESRCRRFEPSSTRMCSSARPSVRAVHPVRS
jgi:hypothetical protein